MMARAPDHVRLGHGLRWAAHRRHGARGGAVAQTSNGPDQPQGAPHRAPPPPGTKNQFKKPPPRVRVTDGWGRPQPKHNIWAAAKPNKLAGW